MKRALCLVFTALFVFLCCVSAFAEDDVILFRGLNWRASYPHVKQELSDLGLMDFRGETVHPYKVIDIMLDQWDGNNGFDYTDINIFAYATRQTKVAGYMTSDIKLHFAYIPEDGVPTHDESRAALYGATYEFELEDVDAAYEDLTKKLTGLYGSPNEGYYTKEDFFGYDIEFILWTRGESEMVLGKKYSKLGKSDMVWISYATDYGNSYLQMASDAEKAAQQAAEAEAASSPDTSGL